MLTGKAKEEFDKWFIHGEHDVEFTSPELYSEQDLFLSDVFDQLPLYMQFSAIQTWAREKFDFTLWVYKFNKEKFNFCILNPDNDTLSLGPKDNYPNWDKAANAAVKRLNNKINELMQAEDK